MSSKRKFSEFGAESSAAGETRSRIPGYQKPKFKKARNVSQDNLASIAWIKKRARTIERRLNHSASLPANVQHDLEKELEHHRQKIDDQSDKKKRNDMIKKYHMVRFFERKKADRLVKQLRTQLEATTDKEEKKKFEADLHIAEIDALYPRYFPHRERYVSLYPSPSSDQDAQGSAKAEDASAAARSLNTERPPLWGEIEKAAKKGTWALTQIQERRLTRSKAPREGPSKHSSVAKAGPLKTKTPSAPESADSNRGKGKRQQPTEPSDSGSDGDSDGGFFEEG
ncbi:hypothetical protein F4678DRAFT_70530 [Xylaria arbuscula]|nr:hypothetical protein F4678DRAFT_70530 [Xylaria arbuscula]